MWAVDEACEGLAFTELNRNNRGWMCSIHRRKSKYRFAVMCTDQMLALFVRVNVAGVLLSGNFDEHLKI